MNQSAEAPLNPKVDALIADITQLMNEAEQMLNDSTSSHAEPQVELLRAKHQSLGTCLTALCASASRTVADGARCADRRIRSNPYEALAIALGTGLLFGVAFSRRR